MGQGSGEAGPPVAEGPPAPRRAEAAGWCDGCDAHAAEAFAHPTADLSLCRGCVGLLAAAVRAVWPAAGGDGTVRRVRVYARDLMPGDRVVAAWVPDPDSPGAPPRRTRDWTVAGCCAAGSKVEVRASGVEAGGGAGTPWEATRWHSPWDMFSVDREV